VAAKILVIEDHAENAILFAYLLSTSGHQVITVETGKEGLEMALSQHFDLILCDIRMSGMDGYEVARQIKSNSRWDKTPLIAITAQAMVGDREQILAAGFDGYLSKPISPHVFLKQIESYLGMVPAKTDSIIRSEILPG